MSTFRRPICQYSLDFLKFLASGLLKKIENRQSNFRKTELGRIKGMLLGMTREFENGVARERTFDDCTTLVTLLSIQRLSVYHFTEMIFATYWSLCV